MAAPEYVEDQHAHTRIKKSFPLLIKKYIYTYHINSFPLNNKMHNQ